MATFGGQRSSSSVENTSMKPESREQTPPMFPGGYQAQDRRCLKVFPEDLADGDLYRHEAQEKNSCELSVECIVLGHSQAVN
ncbi:hypothetical protein H920_06141 [Fukomys damarensis]|uniref:Uncharacterized protein n=1 Tax=Fukomys damarensis TaxID=885580 RepID=A0A091DMW7_FUKDA|nr:hypothetical protein H920_06141 [Fukomys damarensis]